MKTRIEMLKEKGRPLAHARQARTEPRRLKGSKEVDAHGGSMERIHENA